MAKKYKTHFVLGAKLQRSVGKSFGKIQKNMRYLRGQANLTQKTFGKVGGAIKTALGAAVSAVGVYTIGRTLNSSRKAAENFQYQMADVATLMGKNVEPRIESMEKQIKRFAIQTGVSTDKLNKGLYQVISAFGDTEDSMKNLQTATRASVAGNTSVVESVNLLSAVSKGYGDISNDMQKRVADLAFQTVKLGQTTFPELASSMGKVVPLASGMGTKIESLFGAMATLTGVTGNTAEVSTQLRGVFAALTKPTAAMQKVINGVGYSSGKALIQAKGFQGAINLLSKAVGGSEQQLGEMFGRVEALNAVLALTGAQSDNLTEKTKAMTNATGAMDKAFKTKAKTLRNLKNRFFQLWNVIKIDAGTLGLPFLNKVLTRIVNNSGKIRKSINNFMKDLGKLNSKFMGEFSQIGSYVWVQLKWIKAIGTEAFDNIGKVIEKNAPFFQKLNKILDNIGDSLLDAFESAKPAIKWLFVQGLPEVVGLLIDMADKGLAVIEKIGPRALASIQKAIERNRPTIEKLQTTFEQIGDQLSTLGTNMKNAFTAARPTLEWMATDGLGKVVDLLAAVVNKGMEVYNFISDNWSMIEPIVAGVTAAVVAYKVATWELVAAQKAGMVVQALSKAWKFANVVLGMYQSGMSLAATAQWALNAAMAANPAGVVAVAIGALVTAGWLLYKNWDKIGSYLGDIFSGIANMAKQSFNWVIGHINTLITAINKISFKVPDWVPKFGGKEFGINIEHIPKITDQQSAVANNTSPGTQKAASNKISNIFSSNKTTEVIQGNGEQSRAENLLNDIKNQKLVTNNNNQPVSVNLSVTNDIKGNADEETLNKANQDLKLQVEQAIKDVLHGNNRTSFDGSLSY